MPGPPARWRRSLAITVFSAELYVSALKVIATGR